MKPSKTENLFQNIKTNPLFETLTDTTWETFSKHLEHITLKKGEFLFHQNEPCSAMYIVTHGELQTIMDEKGNKIKSGKIKENMPVGEIQILSGGKRTAGVYALTNTKLIKIPKTAIEYLEKKDTPTVTQMARIIKQRLRQNRLIKLLPAFLGPLNEKIINEIENHTEWRHLKRDQILFHQGDSEDNLYILVCGRLKAVVTSNENERVVGEIEPGESIGEMAMFSPEPRSASIHAVRDSELIMFTKKNFEDFSKKYPQILMAVTRTIIARLRRTISAPEKKESPLSIAILPITDNVPSADFCEQLASHLSSIKPTLHLNSKSLDKLMGTPGISRTPENQGQSIRVSAWLDEQEHNYSFIVYEADKKASNWTKRCARQADRVLLLADTSGGPSKSNIEEKLFAGGNGITSAGQTLVLLHRNGNPLPSGTGNWYKDRQLENHHHIYLDRDADFARLARYISGRTTGLVLGGGGARGLAHIGVLRAFQEAGISIDSIGGTSMGAVIASQYALGWDIETMVRTNKTIFLEQKPFKDFTLPLVSFLKSKKIGNIIKEGYGGAEIEDLLINFFCVSSNLTTGEMIIHKNGPLHHAVRAGISLPGVLVPVVQEGQLLIDGGVLNNLPGDVMKGMGIGRVISVNVSGDSELAIDRAAMPTPWEVCLSQVLPFRKSIEYPNILEIMMQTVVLSSIHREKEVKAGSDLYLDVPVGEFGLLEFDKIDRLIETGYDYAKNELASCR